MAGRVERALSKVLKRQAMCGFCVVYAAPYGQARRSKCCPKTPYSPTQGNSKEDECQDCAPKQFNNEEEAPPASPPREC